MSRKPRYTELEARIAPRKAEREGAPDGETFASPLYRNAKPYAIPGVAGDKTEDSKAVTALRESEQRYRRIVDTANDGFWELDAQHRTVIVNPQMARMLGWTCEDLEGKCMRDFVLPEDMPAHDAETAMLVQGIPQRSERRFLRQDGTVLWASVSATPVMDGGGRFSGSIGMLGDITARKHAEEEKEKLMSQLLHAQKMEAIGTLAGGIAHDFNNLLMGIQGYTSLLQSDATPPRLSREYLGRIEEQVRSGAELTKQLLGLARGTRAEMKPMDVNGLVKKTSLVFGRTKKEIVIHVTCREDVLTVEADRGQIEQVLLNMYVNAWQAMPAGGELYLETKNLLFDAGAHRPHGLMPGPYVRISVTDTGVGMDSATRQKIFDPFFTTKEPGRGTGLGLTSAYGIVRGHRGAITVYSEPGWGTTFHIYLPASHKACEEESVPSGEVHGGNEMILIVDDEEMIAEVTSMMLEQAGYRTAVAGNGSDAVAFYRSNQGRVDAVILDMIMPGLSGRDTFEQLKGIDNDVKVILSSGYSMNTETRTMMELGCRAFVQKPYRIEELSEKLRNVLSNP